MPKKKKAKKKVAKKKVAKKKGTKKTKKKASKKAFGGYTVNFSGCRDSIETIFGRSSMPPSQMTKKLWAYVKRKRLSNR